MIEVSGQYLDIEVESVINRLKECNEGYFYKTIDTPDNLMVCCPFHKNGAEKRPSMGIHKKSGVCHCFTCDWTGSLAEMVSNFFGLNDFGKYGERWLLQHFKSIKVEERRDLDLDWCRDKKPKQFDYVSEQELDSYRYFHPYMYERKMTNDIIEKFDIGYDKGTDSITFPVRDINGNCLFVARRSVHTKFFSYPKGVEKPVYGLYEINKYCKNATSIAICESMIDAITCWVYCKPAVALNGLGNDLQFKQLREMNCREFILATDNDSAGMRARERIAQNVTNKILKQYILPKGKKDINELDKDEFDDLLEVFV